MARVRHYGTGVLGGVPASDLKIVRPSEAGIFKEILMRMEALIANAGVDAEPGKPSPVA